ncbi:hypothetical protein ES705_16724 [subsurface metagenome]
MGLTRLTVITLWLSIQIIIQTNGSNSSDRYYIMAFNSNYNSNQWV